MSSWFEKKVVLCLKKWYLLVSKNILHNWKFFLFLVWNALHSVAFQKKWRFLIYQERKKREWRFWNSEEFFCHNVFVWTVTKPSYTSAAKGSFGNATWKCAKKQINMRKSSWFVNTRLSFVTAVGFFYSWAYE